jgi:hypothetical protein
MSFCISLAETGRGGFIVGFERFYEIIGIFKTAVIGHFCDAR